LCPNAVDILVDLLQASTGQAEILTDTAELLYTVCLNPAARNILVSNVDYAKRIRMLHSTFVRRQNAEDKKKSSSKLPLVEDKNRRNTISSTVTSKAGSATATKGNRNSLTFLTKLAEFL